MLRFISWNNGGGVAKNPGVICNLVRLERMQNRIQQEKNWNGGTQWAVQRGEGGVSKHGYGIATKPFLNDGGVIGHQ